LTTQDDLAKLSSRSEGKTIIESRTRACRGIVPPDEDNFMLFVCSRCWLLAGWAVAVCCFAFGGNVGRTSRFGGRSGIPLDKAWNLRNEKVLAG